MPFPCNKRENVIKHMLLLLQSITERWTQTNYLSLLYTVSNHTLYLENIFACFIMYQITLCISRRALFHTFSLTMRFGILALWIILNIQPPGQVFCLTGVSGSVLVLAYLGKYIGTDNRKYFPFYSPRSKLQSLSHFLGSCVLSGVPYPSFH